MMLTLIPSTLQALILATAPGAVDRAMAERPSFRGTVGMMHTPMAMVGAPQSLRVAIQSDFFVKRDLFCCQGPRSDRHRRYRTFFNIGWTPLSWMELQLGLEHGVNRNEREQNNRQDPTQIYAMGDLRGGLKLVAPWWNKLWRAGLAQSLELLSGSSSAQQKGRWRYSADLLGSADLAHLRGALPLRVATSFGVIVDRSHRMFDWSRFDDALSREVFRFGVGSHQSRLRSRLGVDAPLAFGSRHRWGLTPMVELQWDHSLHALPEFAQQERSRGRGAVKLSASVAIHPIERIFIDLGYQTTLLQPGFAFGPKQAPWQLNFALGGSFDLTPSWRRRAGPRYKMAIQSR